MPSRGAAGPNVVLHLRMSHYGVFGTRPELAQGTVVGFLSRVSAQVPQPLALVLVDPRAVRATVQAARSVGAASAHTHAAASLQEDKTECQRRCVVSF